MVKAGQPLSTCIFCRSTFVPGTRGEDVISDWYAKEIGRPVKSVVMLGTIEPTGLKSASAPRNSQTIAAKEFRLTNVCPTCNNDWMSGIEQDAKATLIPMMKGTATTLDSDQQQVVARWAQLKAIAYDAGRGTQRLPVDLAHAFMATRPLRDLGVLLGNYDSASPSDITIARHAGFLPEALALHGPGPVQCVRVTIIFDHLILSVAHAVDGRVPVELLAHDSPEFVHVWPPPIGRETRFVDWPPAQSLNAHRVAECF